MRKATVLDRARNDIRLQQAWYVEEMAFAAAARFIGAVQDLTQVLADMPGIGRLEETTAIAGLRSIGVPDFDSVRLYYLASDDGVTVIRVIHTSRDVPGLLDNSQDFD